MDLVLEVFDTVVFDRIYNAAFPLAPGVQGLTSYEDIRLAFANQSSVLRSLPVEPYVGQLLSVPVSAYLSSIPRSSTSRMALSLFLITWIFGFVVYFFFATLSFVFVFDKRTFNHPKYLKNQLGLEIKQTLSAMPVMSLLTVPWFLAEVTGHSKLYSDIGDYSGLQILSQVALFVAFTDFGTYYIHRALHHPRIYKHLHKKHHKWIVPTPYAAYAFHPVDGYLQSLPYHVFPFLLPLHRMVYLALFGFINIWTVLIHDGEYLANNPIINGSACHTMHHLYFNYNYGQYTTFWDRLSGSYRKPDESLFDELTKVNSQTWTEQALKTDAIMKTIEEEDDRVYSNDQKKTQ